jgi:hypothetical protein
MAPCLVVESPAIRLDQLDDMSNFIGPPELRGTGRPDARAVD